MYTRLTGAIIAAAIALTTAGAIPAQADSRDVARAAAAILGVVALGKILSDRHDRQGDRLIGRVQPGMHIPRDSHGYQGYRPRPRAMALEPQVYAPLPVPARPVTPRVIEPQPVAPRQAAPVEIAPRPLPPLLRDENAKLLPKSCFEAYPTFDGTEYMFSRQCLDAEFTHFDQLPQDCAKSVRSEGRTIRGYEARCLRGRGYALARG